jgi:plastocyanin
MKIFQRMAICALLLCACRLPAQVATVRGRVEVIGARPSHPASIPSTVVWLTPQAGSENEIPKVAPRTDGSLRLVQKNKNFEPHILVVPVGSVVEFPNRDPFFHNVFSLFEAKRFDLGLYEAGSSRMVHFDRAGVSYIFCNIHPEMSAVVITLATPFYAVSTAAGQLSIPDVPYGRWVLHIWSEHGPPEASQTETRDITISEASPALGVIRVPAANGQVLAHKNKYGRNYDQPSPGNPVYRQQP